MSDRVPAGSGGRRARSFYIDVYFVWTGLEVCRRPHMVARTWCRLAPSVSDLRSIRGAAHRTPKLENPITEAQMFETSGQVLFRAFVLRAFVPSGRLSGFALNGLIRYRHSPMRRAPRQ